jgi:hypothetical protein
MHAILFIIMLLLYLFNKNRACCSNKTIWEIGPGIGALIFARDKSLLHACYFIYNNASSLFI